MPREVVKFPSVEVLKSLLEKAMADNGLALELDLRQVGDGTK